MGKKDLIQLVGGFIVVTLLLIFAIMFPVYGVYQNLPSGEKTYVRRPLWDPPNLYGKPAEFVEVEDRLAEFAAADGAMRLPSIELFDRKAQPIFLDPVRSVFVRRRNIFGSFAFTLFVAYVVFVIWKWSWRG